MMKPVRTVLTLLLLLMVLLAPPLVAQEGGRSEGAGPLTLDQAISAALDASQETFRARQEVRAARADLAGAKAEFGPTISAEGGFALIGNPQEGVSIPTGALGTAPDPASTFPQPVPDQPFVLIPDQENLGLSLSIQLEQTLFSWGKLQSARAAAEAELFASGASLDMTRRQVRRQASESYVALAITEESLPRVRAIIGLLEERLSDRELQFREGTVTQSAVLAERALLAGGRTQLVRTEQGVASARAALAYLTGVDDPQPQLPGLPDGIPEEQELVSRALGDYPQLNELKAREDQAQVQVDVLEASRPFLPDIGLTVTADAQGQRLPLIQANWNDLWTTNVQITIGARVLLYDYGRNEAQLESARAQAAQAQSGVTELGESLPLQVRERVARFAIAQAGLAEADARLADATEQDRNASVSFENELISRRDRLGAALQLEEAELSRLAALQSLWQAFFALEELVGPLR